MIDCADNPHVEVREFCLPPATSKRLLVSEQGCEASKNKVINNEDLLTPRKESFLKNMGKNWAKSQTVRNMIMDQFDGTQISTQLTYSES